MAAVLVTLTQAKAHLRITLPALDPGDVDIQLKLDQAEAIVLERCSASAWWAPIATAWTAGTVPLSVHAAILLVLTHLFEHRGDDMKTDDDLWIAVNRLIGLNKDPVIA